MFQKLKFPTGFHRLGIAFFYTLAVLLFLHAQDIISPQTLIPFLLLPGLILFVFHLPFASRCCLHARWLTSVFCCGFISHFYLSLMSYGAYYEQFNFLGALDLLFHTALYILLFFITDSLRLSFWAGGLICGILGIVNHYIWLFRGSPLGLDDLGALTTAAGVAGHYSYLPDQYILLLFPMLLLWIWTLSGLRGDTYVHGSMKFKNRCALLCLLLFISLPFSGYGRFYSENADTFNYQLYLSDLLASLCKKSMPIIPESYSARAVELLVASQPDTPRELSDTKPNIIAIMSESYGDLRVLGDFETNIPVTPFMDSLKDNTVRGFAYSSVFGSQTANSEFEFLSGDSSLFFSDSIVYLHHFNDNEDYDSLVSVLRDQGYSAEAMHPYLRAGWNRPAVYSKMGFEQMRFIEDMPDAEIYRLYTSDAYNFQQIIDRFEQKTDDAPLFLFNVTMQNHGGYTSEGENYEATISIKGHEGEFPKAEMFLSGQHESDQALKMLIDYFSDYDEPTAIVFFGDHQPQLDDAFYDFLDPTLTAGGEESMRRYLVPFFIWCNYDIPEEDGIYTSLNYLGAETLKRLGLQTSDYQNYLLRLQERWPVISAAGLYSPNGTWYAPDTVLTWSNNLKQYQEFAVNHTIDQENTVDDFFDLKTASGGT